MADQSPQALMTEEDRTPPQTVIINDFTIQVGTVNGSGSMSSNSVLMRSIFQMGIPVSGKNMFPSNIAGLPTWFTIRTNKDGWIARRKAAPRAQRYVGEPDLFAILGTQDR